MLKRSRLIPEKFLLLILLRTETGLKAETYLHLGPVKTHFRRREITMKGLLRIPVLSKTVLETPAQLVERRHITELRRLLIEPGRCGEVFFKPPAVFLIDRQICHAAGISGLRRLLKAVKAPTAGILFLLPAPENAQIRPLLPCGLSLRNIQHQPATLGAYGIFSALSLRHIPAGGICTRKDHSFLLTARDGYDVPRNERYPPPPRSGHAMLGFLHFFLDLR